MACCLLARDLVGRNNGGHAPRAPTRICSRSSQWPQDTAWCLGSWEKGVWGTSRERKNEELLVSCAVWHLGTIDYRHHRLELISQADIMTCLLGQYQRTQALHSTKAHCPRTRTPRGTWHTHGVYVYGDACFGGWWARGGFVGGACGLWAWPPAPGARHRRVNPAATAAARGTVARAQGGFRGAPKKNKIESDVYLADDKMG
jgi:hypothetical protein